MNKDEIIRMAREAGFSEAWTYAVTGGLERFASLVAAAEREACAKAVEDMVHGNVKTCAAAIRARGNT